MTKEDIRTEVNIALGMCEATGMVSEEVLDVMKEAMKEKFEREDNKTAVKQDDYIKALDIRKEKLNDAALGRFVKKTIWTVVGE